jgi:2-methylcitrate dehydratase PrpD
MEANGIRPRMSCMPASAPIPTCRRTDPSSLKDELQAKFSMEFCMAILLLEGRAGLNELTEAAVECEDVKAMIEKGRRGGSRRLPPDDHADRHHARGRGISDWER